MTGKPWLRRKTVQTLALAALAAAGMTIPGCGCFGPRDLPEKQEETLPFERAPKERAPVMEEQSPASPVPVPDSPPAEPATPATAPLEAKSDKTSLRERVASAIDKQLGMRLTLENLEKIKQGMNYKDVAALAGVPGVIVSGANAETTLYRFVSGGVSFYCSFENGVLVRKTPYTNANGTRAKLEGPRLTEDNYNLVRPGMTLAEVMELLGVQARMVAGDNAKNAVVYQWSDDAGSSFTARFENDTLARKTAFYQGPLADKDKTPLEQDAGADAAPEPESLPQDQETGSETAAAANHREGDYAPEEPAESAKGETADESGEETAAPERVRIAGAAKRERDAEDSSPVAGRSFKPRARLPQYAHSLRRGVYEIRIFNDGDAEVQAGLRMGKRGKDVSVPPGGSKSFFVDQGDYELYYIYKNAPYTLQHGRALRIDAFFSSDVAVHLFDEEGSENQ